MAISSKLSNPLLDVNRAIDSLVAYSSNNSFAGSRTNSYQDLTRVETDEAANEEPKTTLKEISQTQIIQKLLLNMIVSNRRRSQSWPRSKLDQLQLNNFNREIRLLYYQSQSRHLYAVRNKKPKHSTKQPYMKQNVNDKTKGRNILHHQPRKHSSINITNKSDYSIDLEDEISSLALTNTNNNNNSSCNKPTTSRAVIDSV
jgi:hypothetical protein